MLARLQISAERLSSVLLYVSAVAIALIAIAGAADAIGSAVFNRPISGVFELTGLSLVVIIFMAQPYVTLSGSHIELDLFRFDRKSVLGRTRHFLTSLFGAICYAAIFIASWRGFTEAWHVREATAGIYAFPVYPVKLILVIGAFLAFCMSVLSFFVRSEAAKVAETFEEGL
ncbi:MAG: TRAP transporter small permease [Pseudolabrys sp.]|nr:TRAP transporter small permease [Pseudolabrys sp.]